MKMDFQLQNGSLGGHLEGACSQAAPASGYQHREGTRLSRRGRCFLESGEWEEKGRDEGKTGKEGHNRDDLRGQEATVCL